MLIVPINEVRSTDTMALSFMEAVLGKRYIEFRYDVQLRRKNTPSAVAARADTQFIGDFDQVKGFLDDNAVFWAKTTGHWCLRVWTMNRRVATNNGYWSDHRNCRTAEDFKQGEYLPRTYRLVGIRKPTALVGMGRQGKVRMFPDEPYVMQIRI